MASGSFALSVPAPAYPFPEDLLPTLLAISLTAVNLLRPLYNSDDAEIVDFHLDYLNLAAQRITGLCEQPQQTALTRFPDLATNGVLDFYRRTYLSGTSDTFQFNYQADGFDNFFCISAQRCGQVLVVSFTDTADHPRTPAENALRESQAAERVARAEVEAQRQRFYEILQQLPALVATHQGPDHVYTFVNSSYQRYFPSPGQLPGRSIREVLPEAEEQGVFALMDRVYQTGEPYYGQELEVWLDYTEGVAPRQQVFLSLLFHPLRDAQGHVSGPLDFSYDVTEQVRARQRLQQLNQELEARVQRRTAEAQAARAEAEVQRSDLQRVFEQAPVSVAIFRGPTFVVELANAEQDILWGRPVAQVLGRPLFEALPDIAGQGLEEIFMQVLATGEPHQVHEICCTIDRAATGLPEQGYFTFTYQPLRDAHGRVTGLMPVGVEVTEQVLARRQVDHLNEGLAALNAELNESNRQLTRTNVDLDTFVYTASHDLKAPITNIEGIALALRDTLAPVVHANEEVAHLLVLLDQTVARFQFTIAQLTDISRLQLAHAGPAELVGLATIVEAVRLDLVPARGGRN